MIVQEENYEQGFKALSWIVDNKLSYFSSKDLFEFIFSFKEFIYNQLHNILVNNEDNESEKLRRKYCKYVIAKLLPINKQELEKFTKKIIQDTMTENDWEIYNKWLDLNDDLMALASYRSLYHFAVYMEYQDPEENKVWKYTMDTTMGSIFYYAQSMILNHKYTNLIKQCPTGYGKCLHPSTNVLTPSGNKKIKDIEIGDIVYSFRKNEIIENKVINKWNTKKQYIKLITKSGKEIITSYEHRMLTQNGYKETQELNINNDCLILYENNNFVYDEIESLEYNLIEIAMVDIEVENDHNFIANGLVSHNSKSDCDIIAFIFGYDINATVLKIVGNPSVIQGNFNGIINMMKSEKYRKVFPQFARYEKPEDIFSECKSNMGAFTLKGSKAGRSLYIANKETPLDGTRYNYQFFDDVTQSKEKYNMQQHLKDRSNYLDQWSKRMYNENTVLRFITGTAYHNEDLISYLKRFYNDNLEYQIDLEAFKHFKWAKFAKLSEDKKTVYIGIQGLVDLELGEEQSYSSFPEKYSKSFFLKDLHHNFDMFMAMTQQTPVPSEAQAFDYTRLKQYSELPKEITNKISDCETYCMIDPSKKGKDNYCGIILKKAKDGYYYWVDVYYKPSTSKMAIPKICEMCARHKVDYIIYEQNATDEDLLEEKIKEVMSSLHWNNYSLDSFYSTQNKEDKIHTMQDDIKEKIKFPQKGMYYSTSQMGMAISDVVNYTFDGKNAHDDSIDCLAMFLQWINNNSDNDMWFSNFSI